MVDIDYIDKYMLAVKALSKNTAILESFRAKTLSAVQIDGMPHSICGATDMVCDLAIEILELKNCITKLKTQVEEMEKEISSYIDSIDDLQTRMIVRLRVLRHLQWASVAYLIGDNCTAEMVRKSYRRHFNTMSGTVRYCPLQSGAKS